MDNKIPENILKEAFKPYDIVTDSYGCVGFINEVHINTCQPEPYPVSYSVEWLVGRIGGSSWYEHYELKKHCNLFVKIAECSCNKFGNNGKKVSEIMASGI